jgi:hypothetical protein
MMHLKDEDILAFFVSKTIKMVHKIMTTKFESLCTFFSQDNLENMSKFPYAILQQIKPGNRLIYTLKPDKQLSFVCFN